MSVFDLPMTARPGKDAIAGQDELGRTVYRTVTGERYTMPERVEMPAPTMGQRFENLGGLASRAYEGLSVQGAIDAAKGIGEGIISGIVQGFTAPGRALSGEPVSMGDVLATAGMAQVGAAPMRAPAGSLRSGATGGGRPPVTFDDVARAMDEVAPAPSPSFTLYQGSPHNFAAERLVRMPDGSTQYIVGAPDVLPDVPTGAEVLQDFPLGRQRSDKIGTGEGAQAYGYGLYGAEAEGVAKGYRNALSPDQVSIAGKAYDIPPKSGVLPRDVRDALGLGDTGADYTQEVYDAMSNARFSGTSPIAEFDEIAAARVKELEDDIAAATGANYKRETSRFLEEEKKRLSVLRDALSSKDVSTFGSKGSMYEMQINADPEAFLDWDKPLSEQPQDVQDALTANLPEYKVKNLSGTPHAFTGDRMIELTDPNLTGRDAYILARMGQAGTMTSEQAAAASNALREAGIPGIKYLDSGSRGAGGTRNYVIFDENLISIVRKYGIAGAAAMLGVSAIDVEQALADNLPQDQWESLVVGK